MQIRVSLVDIDSAVWRRLLVPRDRRIGQLHHVVRAALARQSSHPYEFHIGGLRCRDPEQFDLGRTDRDVGDARGQTGGSGSRVATGEK